MKVVGDCHPPTLCGIVSRTDGRDSARVLRQRQRLFGNQCQRDRSMASSRAWPSLKLTFIGNSISGNKKDPNIAFLLSFLSHHFVTQSMPR